MWCSFLEQFSSISPYRLIEATIEINFKKEEGIDAGGLAREFYSKIFKDFMDPTKGFFSTSSNGITT